MTMKSMTFCSLAFLMHEIFQTKIFIYELKCFRQKIINIGKGGACAVPTSNYSITKKNKASTIVYIISPPMFFSNDLPLSSNTFDFEPFDI